MFLVIFTLTTPSHATVVVRSLPSLYGNYHLNQPICMAHCEQHANFPADSILKQPNWAGNHGTGNPVLVMADRSDITSVIHGNVCLNKCRLYTEQFQHADGQKTKFQPKTQVLNFYRVRKRSRFWFLVRIRSIRSMIAAQITM